MQGGCTERIDKQWLKVKAEGEKIIWWVTSAFCDWAGKGSEIWQLCRTRYDSHSSVRLGDLSELWRIGSVTLATLKSDSGNWARLGGDFLGGIYSSISSQYMDSEKDMPTECVGFFPTMLLIYSKQFPNAISKTTEMYFTFFLVKRNEDYLHARYSQRPYRKMSYLRRLFGYLNTFKCPYALQLQIWVCVCVRACV